MRLQDTWKSFDELEERHRGDPVLETLPAWTDPITFAQQEWEGLDWLSEKEDRGAFLAEFWKDPRDSIIMGAKETAKSLTLSILAIELMLYTPLKTIGIIAGSEDQAKITYGHIRRLLHSGKHTPAYLEEEPLAVNARLKDGREVRVYASSYYSAHGWHPHVVMADEAVLASKTQGGEVLSGALASVTTGGVRIMASAPYYQDPIFMETWRNADEWGYKRYGPWMKHPWEELKEPFIHEVDRRPWIKPFSVQVDEARRAMANPSSNYMVFWLGQPQAGTGDVFRPDSIDLCTEPYDLAPRAEFTKSIGIDTGFASSMFAVCGIEDRGDALYVIMAEEYERPNFNDMAVAITNAYVQGGYTDSFCDASNKPFSDLLGQLGIYTERVAFGTELPPMISSTQLFFEQRRLRIHPRFRTLIWQLKNARWAKGGRKIDKTGKSTMDSVDALMCALRRWTKEP